MYSEVTLKFKEKNKGIIFVLLEILFIGLGLLIKIIPKYKRMPIKSIKSRLLKKAYNLAFDSKNNFEKSRYAFLDESISFNAQRVDFSAYKFLNATSEKTRNGLIKKIYEFCKKNNFKTLYCDNRLKLDFLKFSENNKQFKFFDNEDKLLAYLKKNKISKVFILSCNQNKILEISSSLQEASVSFSDIKKLALNNIETIPKECFVKIDKNIYPLYLPKIKFKKNLDMLLMDCPSRNLSMMPNGLGYVHNALKKTDIKFQTFDLDIVTYHRYHIERIFDLGGETVLPSGKTLPIDPWQAEHYDLWGDKEVIDYFMPIINEAAEEITKVKPKILGLSIQQCNEAFSRQLVKIVKSKLPDIIIVVGGFSCYNPTIGLHAFPEAEYMCIGESDYTVSELVKKIINSRNKPKDIPGVISIHDSKDRFFIPAPQPNDLDKLDDPRYEWFSLDIYRNWDGYQLTPVIASRGCRWSRCTFCAERFYWRIRNPKKFVDELEYLISQGCHLFMFNESDLNGDPDVVLQICDEIIKRKLKLKLTAQLRIHKKSDKAFFMKLKKAGFVALRFGVDAFSKNTLKLQKKGYTVETISQNLKDCWESGIYTEVNWVIGVPGETDEDCEEGIELITKNKDYIGRIANINPLIMVNGSVYWIDPESHGIRFRGDKKQILQDNVRVVPANLWYSINPFIDAAVRKARFENIIVKLMDNGFKLGPWAEKIYHGVKHNLDKNRSIVNN